MVQVGRDSRRRRVHLQETGSNPVRGCGVETHNSLKRNDGESHCVGSPPWAPLELSRHKSPATRTSRTALRRGICRRCSLAHPNWPPGLVYSRTKSYPDRPGSSSEEAVSGNRTYQEIAEGVPRFINTAAFPRKNQRGTWSEKETSSANSSFDAVEQNHYAAGSWLRRRAAIASPIRVPKISSHDVWSAISIRIAYAHDPPVRKFPEM